VEQGETRPTPDGCAVRRTRAPTRFGSGYRIPSHLDCFPVQVLSTTLILVAAVINIMPVAGLASGERLRSLYGIAFDETNLLILMRHRAVLFGIVGGLLVASAFHLPLRPVAFAVGLISMLSFVLIAWLAGTHNAELRRIVMADLVGSFALVGAALLDHQNA
jgi:hypothetical protein